MPLTPKVKSRIIVVNISMVQSNRVLAATVFHKERLFYAQLQLLILMSIIDLP
jgi:hypothetical protein